MNKQFTSFLAASSLFLLTHTVQAQAAFSIGPRLGLTVAGQGGAQDSYTTSSYRTGFAAGVQGIINLGHLGIQPTLSFVQKGLRQRTGIATSIRTKEYRLNYLSLPVNLAYSLREEGQGLQLFAGPYVGLLLGGSYYSTYLDPANGSDFSQQGQVKAGTYQPIPWSPTAPIDDQYTRRYDMGLQAGLGYRFGSLLAQAEFSFGLRDLAPVLTSTHNRTLQVSLSYLFMPKQ